MTSARREIRKSVFLLLVYAAVVMARVCQVWLLSAKIMSLLLSPFLQNEGLWRVFPFKVLQRYIQGLILCGHQEKTHLRKPTIRNLIGWTQRVTIQKTHVLPSSVFTAFLPCPLKREQCGYGVFTIRVQQVEYLFLCKLRQEAVRSKRVVVKIKGTILKVLWFLLGTKMLVLLQILICSPSLQNHKEVICCCVEILCGLSGQSSSPWKVGETFTPHSGLLSIQPHRLLFSSSAIGSFRCARDPRSSAGLFVFSLPGCSCEHTWLSVLRRRSKCYFSGEPSVVPKGAFLPQYRQEFVLCRQCLSCLTRPASWTLLEKA